MTINDGVAKQFERTLSPFADELHLSPFQCRMFSKKLAELETQPLTKRNRRSEFASWVSSRTERSHTQSSSSKLPKFDSSGFDRSGTRYRVMRIYDEMFSQRSPFVALIDSYYDEGKISSERALQLIDFTKSILSQKNPGCFLHFINRCCSEEKIAISLAVHLFDLMERLPSRPLLLFLADWYAEEIISERDMIQVLALIERAFMPIFADGMLLDDPAVLPKRDPLGSRSVEFNKRVVGLIKEKGMPLKAEIIALFTQIVQSLNTWDEDTGKNEFHHFLHVFIKCLEQKNASTQLECLENWNHYLNSKKSCSSSDLAQPVRASSISKIERDAYSYWLPRIYDEIHGTRSSYDRCIDELYDEEQLTMNTANKLLALPDQVEDESGDSFCRFSQKLCAIRHPKTLPERFSEEAFNLILSRYQGS